MRCPGGLAHFLLITATERPDLDTGVTTKGRQLNAQSVPKPNDADADCRQIAPLSPVTLVISRGCLYHGVGGGFNRTLRRRAHAVPDASRRSRA